MKTISRKILTLLFSILMLAALTIPAFAQSVPPPTTGAWSEVVDQNGNVNYGKLTDGGVVQQQANWMPSVLGVGLPASYHVYYTPSGNKILMPTASTLFFMAANSNESGWNAAQTLGTSGASETTGSNGTSGVGIASLGQVFGYLAGTNPSFLPGNVSNATDFFNQVFSGQTNLWSLDPGKMFNLLASLGKADINDHSLYTYMLLYAPDQCASTPGGCSAAQLALLATPVPPSPPPPSKCPASSVVQGVISAGGQKTYPNYPLVVGQDPDKTGVSVSLYASVAPTKYTYYTPESTSSCEPGAVNGVYTCWTGSTGGHKVNSGYTCVQHTQTFNECIAAAWGEVTLSPASKDWILNTLSLQYPGAYIHNPWYPINGSGCAWKGSSWGSLQIDDPGIWNILVSGHTSGTPVSGPRGFNLPGADFSVALKEVMIVQ